MFRTWLQSHVSPPPFCFLAGSTHSPPSSSSTPTTNHSTLAMATSSVRIAVVGDCHDQWNLQEDNKALQFLKPDLVLFTGDFGNENVELVQSIADVDFAKAAILGNHDAWKTQQFSKKKKDAVQIQMQCLGDAHVGYRRLDFPLLKLSVVGGRPFSSGGEALFRRNLLSSRYGVHDMEQSAKKIYETALGTPVGNSIVFLAHNGPKGLGSNRNDICGKDWGYGAGDHGDSDLAKAISDFKETTQAQFSVPLVVFGHMHKELAYKRGVRKMIVAGADNTIYLNGAVVPRVKILPETEATIRAFTLVEILNGNLEKITETWISVIGDKTKLEEEHIMFENGILLPS